MGAENAALKQLVDLMPSVKYAGDKTDIVAGFDPASLLPGLQKIISSSSNCENDLVVRQNRGELEKSSLISHARKQFYNSK